MLIVAMAVVALLAGGAVGYVRLAAQPDDDLPILPGHYGSTYAVCALLDKADLAVALGKTYRDGAAPIRRTLPFADVAGVTKCAYTSLDQHEADQGVEVAVVYAYAEQIFEQSRKRFRRQTVHGVGRKATWYPEAGELWVLAGDKMVGVVLPGAAEESPPDRIERARRLAAKAVARLGQRPEEASAHGAGYLRSGLEGGVTTAEGPSPAG